jgi:hypothetical protein
LLHPTANRTNIAMKIMTFFISIVSLSIFFTAI